MLIAVLLTMPVGIGISELSAQAPRSLSVQYGNGQQGSLPVVFHRGYPAVEAGELEPLGWQLGRDGDVHRMLHRTGLELRFVSSSPYFRWEDEPLQMVEPAYVFGGSLHVPLQLLTDFYPAILPNAYAYDPAMARFEVAEAPTPGTPGLAGARDPGEGGAAAAPPAERLPPRLVVIDPGHGGEDPGAIGPGGTREKDVALAIGLALARELADDPGYEVRLTRDRDVIVPIWERGERATAWREGRPGVFLSIHANALPDRPGVRGFETYFLSEARTEHERRVAAAENAPVLRERDGADDIVDDPLLGTILRDLRTFDHQQWSSLLAEIVQEELGSFHPGPDRGVKQGPLAVITNALMPSVLVEVGFVTNRDEERLLNRPDFHQDTARALAAAVRRFFDRYPAAGT